MTSLRPYGDIAILKDYVSNIGLKETTLTGLLTRAATNIETEIFGDTGGEFDSNYKLLNMVKDYTELQAACQGHLMYGDRQDAKIYCDMAQKKLERIIYLDSSSETAAVEGTLEPALDGTYPSNPLGHRLEGRSPAGEQYRTVPPWA
jgi:hypothetical protein